MLHRLGEHIEAAKHRARTCRERALDTDDPGIKAEWQAPALRDLFEPSKIPTQAGHSFRPKPATR